MTFNSGGKKDPDGKMSPGERERRREARQEQDDSKALQRALQRAQRRRQQQKELKERLKELSLAQGQDRPSSSSLTVQSRPVNGGGHVGRRHGYRFAPSKEQSTSPPLPPAVIAARRAALFRSASEHRGYWEERAGYVEKCPDCRSALPKFCFECRTALRDTCLACGVCPGCQFGNNAVWKQRKHSVHFVADYGAGAAEDAAIAKEGGGIGGEEVPTFTSAPSFGHSNTSVCSSSNTNAASSCTQASAPTQSQVSRSGAAGKQALTVDVDAHLPFSSPPRHTASNGGSGLANYAMVAGDFRSRPSRAANGTFPDSTSRSASPPSLPSAEDPIGKMSPGKLERRREARQEQDDSKALQRALQRAQRRRQQQKELKERLKELSLAQSQDRPSSSSLTVQSRPVNGGGHVGRRYGHHFAPSKEQSTSPPVPPAVIAARRAALFRSASEHRGYWEERAGYVEKCPDCRSALPESCFECRTALRDTCLACGVCPGCQYGNNAVWKHKYYN